MGRQGTDGIVEHHHRCRAIFRQAIHIPVLRDELRSGFIERDQAFGSKISGFLVPRTTTAFKFFEAITSPMPVRPL